MGNWKIIVSGSTKDFETDYGFRVYQSLGTGVAPISIISSDFGYLDGSIFERQRAESRQISLIGAMSGSNAAAIHSKRKGLIDVVKPDRTSGSQEAVVIQYVGSGGSTLQASAYYQGGLELPRPIEGRIDHSVGLRFWLPDPFFEGLTAASVSASHTSVSGANYILQRDTSGSWVTLGSGLGAGVDGRVFDIAKAGSRLIVAGSFTTAGGGAAPRIAYWTGSAFGNLSLSGLNNVVNAVAVGPAGSTDIFAVGDFTTAGSVTAPRAAHWNGTFWEAMTSSGLNLGASSVVIDADGSVYVAGDFTKAGSLGIWSLGIARWNGVTWYEVSNACPNGAIRRMILDRNNRRLYIGGAFTNINASTDVNRVAYYNISASTWNKMSTGVNSTVSALAVGPDGRVHLSGAFTTAGGISTGKLATWNGTALQAIEPGLNSNAWDAAVDQADGTLYLGGTFTTAGCITLPDKAATWNGTTFAPLDINLPGSASVTAIHIDTDGTLTIGFDTTGTASAAAITKVNNTGTAATYPVITIAGSGQLHQVKNYTTKQAIYFNNLRMSACEVVTVDLRPTKKTMTSTFSGNIVSYLVPSSNFADWRLEPGINSVSILHDNSSASITISYVPRYWSIDGTAI